LARSSASSIAERLGRGPREALGVDRTFAVARAIERLLERAQARVEPRELARRQLARARDLAAQAVHRLRDSVELEPERAPALGGLLGDRDVPPERAADERALPPQLGERVGVDDAVLRERLDRGHAALHVLRGLGVDRVVGPDHEPERVEARLDLLVDQRALVAREADADAHHLLLEDGSAAPPNAMSNATR
jgi:hypothetical protein